MKTRDNAPQFRQNGLIEWFHRLRGFGGVNTDNGKAAWMYYRNDDESSTMTNYSAKQNHQSVYWH